MALFLDILDGPIKGSRFKVVPGYRLGRANCEILIKDPKISNLHALIETDENGQLYLVDQQSVNGLRIEGEKVDKIALMPGVTFQAGRTLFSVSEKESSDIQVQTATFLKPDGNSFPRPERSWKNTLEGIPLLKLENQAIENPIRPFQPAVKLFFAEGVQAEQTLLLGYGPRKAGADTLDIELQDPASPALAFELIPTKKGILFVTQHPDQVRLNEKDVKSDILRHGDLIRVGKTLIYVELTNA